MEHRVSEDTVLIELSGVSEMLFRSARLAGSVNSTPDPSRHRSGRWILAALPVVALSILLTACGGGSTKTAGATPTTTPATSPSTGTGQASASSSFTKYRQCLTSHGVPATAIGGRGGAPGGGATGSAAGTGASGATGATGAAGGGGAATGTRPTIPAKYQQALQACASLRPTGGFGGFGGLNSPVAAAYRNCLEIHGVKLPTTPTTTPGQPPSTGGFRGGFGQVANNPTFQAAQKACASLLPARSNNTSSTTTATGA